MEGSMQKGKQVLSGTEGNLFSPVDPCCEVTAYNCMYKSSPTKLNQEKQ